MKPKIVYREKKTYAYNGDAIVNDLVYGRTLERLNLELRLFFGPWRLPRCLLVC